MVSVIKQTKCIFGNLDFVFSNDYYINAAMIHTVSAFNQLGMKVMDKCIQINKFNLQQTKKLPLNYPLNSRGRFFLPAVLKLVSEINKSVFPCFSTSRLRFGDAVLKEPFISKDTLLSTTSL